MFVRNYCYCQRTFSAGFHSVWVLKGFVFIAYKIIGVTEMHVGIFLSAATAKVFIVVDLLAEASSDRDAS